MKEKIHFVYYGKLVLNEILNNKSYKCCVVTRNFLLYPEHYRMNLLPNQNELKQKAEEYITELKNIPFLKNRRLLKIIEIVISHFQLLVVDYIYCFLLFFLKHYLYIF